MQNTCKIAVSIPKEDYEKMEDLRHDMEISRSEIYDRAIRFWLKSIGKNELIKQYEAGYKKKPEKVCELKSLEEVQLEVLNQDEDWSDK